MPIHQHLLVSWGPLKLGRLIANGSQAVSLFEPQQTHTLKRWPGHRLVKIGWATRPSIAGWSVLKRVIIPQQQCSYLRWTWKLLPETLIGRMEPRKPQLSATCFKESTRVHTKQLLLWLSFVAPMPPNFFPQAVSTVSSPRPSIAKWQFQNSFLFLLGVWVKLVALLNSATVLWVQRLVGSCTFATLLRSNLSFWLSFVPPRLQTQQKTEIANTAKKSSTSCFYSFIALNSATFLWVQRPT